MVTVFKEPKSYTGEDLVEISCHGNPLLIDEIIGLIIEQGGRLAQAGEFTRRALLNGKFDLIQAEAILDLTTAQSQWARRNAYYQLAGGLSEKIKKIADQLEQVLIQVEANLDFPEDEEWQGLEGIKDQISRIKNTVESELNRARGGIIMRAGPKVVIIGKPNVGKSSLFNRLLGVERVMVTEIPGTTRDFIEENLIIDDLQFRLVDTAGVGWIKDRIEAMAQEQTKKVIKEADLLLLLFDRSLPAEDFDFEIIKWTEDQDRIIIFNKSDLPSRLDHNEILSRARKRLMALDVSARTGDGIEGLTRNIYNFFRNQAPEGTIITRRRHLEALKNVHSALSHALKEDFFETIAVELRSALDALGEMVGKITSEDILNRIFSEFCIGK